MPEISSNNRIFATGDSAALYCVECSYSFPLCEERYFCPSCAQNSQRGLLEVRHPTFGPHWPEVFDSRLADSPFSSGVWRFGECLLPAQKSHIVSHPEGNTRIYNRQRLSDYAGLKELYFKHEGENPSGSFKDRGMTVAVTQARALGKKILGCASTGNTSASLAAYAAQAQDMKALVFLPAGKVASGKLAQAYAYGATCVEVGGDFDAAMALIQTASQELGIYLVNSVNPFRLEGQKTIIWEMLQQLNWQPPDWIVVPGGNLGNTSAFGKALLEAHAAGWISRLPRLAVIQAQGASPFVDSYRQNFKNFVPQSAQTVASAICIGNPVNFAKARRVLVALEGVVEAVTDNEILAAKAQIDASGVGCEPASACSLAGVKKLVSLGVIDPADHVVGILTGNLLKDSECSLQISNSPLGTRETLQLSGEPSEAKKTIETLARYLEDKRG